VRLLLAVRLLRGGVVGLLLARSGLRRVLVRLLLTVDLLLVGLLRVVGIGLLLAGGGLCRVLVRLLLA
ncbi:hypothetical protein, partial [Nocardiopsis sp. LOL_012]|uniref:hypothetical protein n=1 Tax=Nocardiopsis sp. LOL_012 TaxID=3345409 RepID=UPI003A83F55D